MLLVNFCNITTDTRIIYIHVFDLGSCSPLFNRFLSHKCSLKIYAASSPFGFTDVESMAESSLTPFILRRRNTAAPTSSNAPPTDIATIAAGVRSPSSPLVDRAADPLTSGAVGAGAGASSTTGATIKEMAAFSD